MRRRRKGGGQRGRGRGGGGRKRERREKERHEQEDEDGGERALKKVMTLRKGKYEIYEGITECRMSKKVDG